MKYGIMIKTNMERCKIFYLNCRESRIEPSYDRDGQKDRQTHRQTEGQTDKQTEQTDRQADRECV